MKELGLNEIRKQFLDFFESKNHLVKKSYSLVPKDDETLLLINAGMAPLKKYFVGAETPPNTKMATCQKCIRTGDIDNVGKTSRHGTFFEMLGNFSFGDYFKEESINWGWEFLTEVLEIPESKLWVSVYKEDDEAYNIWRDQIGIPEYKIKRYDKSENFWELGSGPCGPCSEIFFDRGEKYKTVEGDEPEADGDRFVEVWNHVFTQYDKDEEGNYNRLDNPNIDTGMGLERIACLMQGVENIFEVDTIRHILDDVCEMSGKTYGEDYETDVSIRIITDHMRSVTFMISDGIMPNNEGRGYVLRRLLRRAARHGKLLGIEGAFLTKLVDSVIEVSKDAYEALLERQEYIKKIVSIEEDRFQETIDQGIDILESYIQEMTSKDLHVLSGEKAFKLYDTYGFPLELTKEILLENDLEVDEETFNQEMEKQRERARSARTVKNESWGENIEALEEISETVFTGYHSYEEDAQVKLLIEEGKKVDEISENGVGVIILDKTPFYAESGGQVADTGVITLDQGTFKVDDVQKNGGLFFHHGKVVEGMIKEATSVTAAIDKKKRMAIARNHSTTHLLHKALKEVLGSHVEQSGSYVDENGLRFDFSHFEKMTDAELSEVERIVNEEILKADTVEVIETSIKEAKKLGATALFGEKYGEEVRVVKMGDFSIELCGGTHLSSTSEAGLFKITSESGIAAGTRRIEGITGAGVLDLLNEYKQTLEKTANALKTNPTDVELKATQLVDQMKQLEQENESLKKELATSNLEEMIEKSRKEINGIDTIIATLENVDNNTLRELTDDLANKYEDIFILLASKLSNKVLFVTKASDVLVNQGVHCGNIVREVAKTTGGGGGGRPTMAQAGGRDGDKVEEALEKAIEMIKSL